MSVFINQESRVVYQGFTGQHATFHAEEAIKTGTNIVGGVTPGKGGTRHLDRPVFDTVADAVREVGADTAGVFVPPRFAADAILEAIEQLFELRVDHRPDLGVRLEVTFRDIGLVFSAVDEHPVPGLVLRRP